MNTQQPIEKNLGDPRTLRVESAGLCCSVGYHLSAAVHALRANMDHFSASGFYNEVLEPITVAALPDDIFGNERQIRWVEFAIRDCASRIVDLPSLVNPKKTKVIVLAPDSHRANSDPSVHTSIVEEALNRFAIGNHDNQSKQICNHKFEDIATLAEGRTGLTKALLIAAQTLAGQHAEQVLLISVDSFLNAKDINNYLDHGRIFMAGNNNGFVPGEAAAAVLFRAAPSWSNGLHVTGVGKSSESGRHDGSVPSRGQGLTRAIRAACVQARISPTDLKFRMSDQNGEQFFSKDSANAITRVMFGGESPKLLTVADKIGEVGAAAGLAMLAWLMMESAALNLGTEESGLIHLANDNGDRCAIVLTNRNYE